jgi:hypothetical protein
VRIAVWHRRGRRHIGCFFPQRLRTPPPPLQLSRSRSSFVWSTSATPRFLSFLGLFLALIARPILPFSLSLSSFLPKFLSFFLAIDPKRFFSHEFLWPNLWGRWIHPQEDLAKMGYT